MIFFSAITIGGLLARISNTKFIFSKVRVACFWDCFQISPHHFENPSCGLDIKSVSYSNWGSNNCSMILLEVGRNWFRWKPWGNEVDADFSHSVGASCLRFGWNLNCLTLEQRSKLILSSLA